MFETIWTIIGIFILIITLFIAVLIAIGVAQRLKEYKKKMKEIDLDSINIKIETQERLSNKLSEVIEAKNALLEDLNKNINRQMEKVSDEA